MLDNWLPVDDAVDDDTSAAIITVTVPVAVGVRLNVYRAPLPETTPTVAFVAVTFALVRPFTDSENVAVTGIVAALVLEPVVEERTTVGPPLAADERDASPPSTAVAAITATAMLERIPIDFAFIVTY